ncbi:sosondowah ankyrin repeat domain family Cb isoform X2 [Sander lucioperca]|uniref:sosondowah ankyrin repeat domain family Cb isoform X2 n=1 Tax=Sander lucioperca TaxID=283035 RepID=UPI001653C517|nr:sosondowah ankyrin repeat domain family Cb isoform X2 [Sander lucioperca]
MAAECTEEAILDFVKENGGKVKNTDLIEHFKVVFPEDPEKRTAVRMKFKSYVDRIAYVKTESGVKYVCLRKQFRGSEKENGTERDLNQERLIKPYNPDRAGGRDAAAGGEVQRQTLPGSGYGCDSQVRVPHAFSTAKTISPDKTDDKSRCHGSVCVVEEADSHSGEMGNRGSLRREQRESKKERVGKAPPRIPEVAVPEASALPAAEGPVFNLPGPAQTGPTGPEQAAGLGPRDTPATESLSREEAGQIPNSKKEDTHSVSGSEGRPVLQVRRSGVFRSSARMSSRNDSDTASVVSSNPDDDRAPATLDPLEHEWMLCASDGEWANLYQLLATEPSLVLRKDFVTGFTCLHWAAKQGKPELIALIINFAKQHSVPASVDVRSSSGYTPLHVAAMHGHMEVVKLLVGAYSADVDARDYSGRKPCHYLTDNVSMDIRDIVGAYERSDAEDEGPRDAGRRWSVSRVLQSHLKPLGDSVDGGVAPREKPLRRKSSLYRMKPKLQKLRSRTSQIVHSTSFRGTEELDGSAKASFKSRPKTHFFG